MQDDIGRLVKMIHDRLKTRMDAMLKENDLTLSQMRVLEYVHQQDDQTTQKEIEDYLGVAHPTVVGIVSRLEKNGFLRCFRHPENKRNKIVCTTEKARSLSSFLSENKKQIDMQIRAGLSHHDVSELCRILQIIHQNLE